jgi:hypothetical protein
VGKHSFSNVGSMPLTVLCWSMCHYLLPLGGTLRNARTNSSQAQQCIGGFALGAAQLVSMVNGTWSLQRHQDSRRIIEMRHQPVGGFALGAAQSVDPLCDISFIDPRELSDLEMADDKGERAASRSESGDESIPEWVREALNPTPWSRASWPKASQPKASRASASQPKAKVPKRRGDLGIPDEDI